MRYDLDQVPTPIAYKLLAATVVPRPIAWVVTRGAQGVNAAPYSFFNVMGSAPPTVALGLLADPERGFKDSAANILETGEFVVNLVPERLVEAMNLTAADAPRGVDELALAGLATLPSQHIAPPRIAESPVAFECRTLSSVVTGPCQTVVIGRVLAVHIEDRYLLDPDRAWVDTDALDLVARSYGSDYIRSHDTFKLDRPTWAGLKAEGKV
ncbi:MAG: flavin reductase family protein [Rhodobacter sp.]|uniref:flavin reductase family protein n=1 Tax=Pararhodobacter sp. TaxID=2127056 RepID=UPI001D86C986|nr:flavin reductase family protein [Pararhodobacter sp.]MCB1346108.1 flavin reductase family protein [Paracoccaceae bacterium]MCC0073202.1 flavin reductase family protein [Rhodobacter sp.]HPD91570.1 flavin reductase family protein [Pararhodobacter sp.]